MRFAVQYVCAGWEARDQAFPVGFVTQDESGIVAQAIDFDAAQVAQTCGVPPSALARWEADARSLTLDPVWGPDGQPLPQTDPRWLTRFAGGSQEAKFFWGPVREVPGSGPEAVEAIVRLLRDESEV